LPNFYAVTPIKKELLVQLGYVWHYDNDGQYFVDDKVIEVTEKEAEAYYIAANIVYEMYAEGAAYVIHNHLYDDLNIHSNIIPLIEYSWRHERNNHLYSRFDFAGGIDGLPIKLIEFNADTPTFLFESSLIQWLIFKSNNMGSQSQFNTIYEAITSKYRNMMQDKENIPRFLFSSVDNSDEDINTTKLLQSIVREAGSGSDLAYMQNVNFNEYGVLDTYDNLYDFWFKLYPWEEISGEEKVLMTILSLHCNEKKTKVLNPAYTLLYQSKGMMKILYDLFPDSEYLLHTSYAPLKEKCVRKPMFGREGGNVDIIDENKNVLYTSPGQYDQNKFVYQTYVDFPEDDCGYKYQAGVFLVVMPVDLVLDRAERLLMI